MHACRVLFADDSPTFATQARALFAPGSGLVDVGLVSPEGLLEAVPKLKPSVVALMVGSDPRPALDALSALMTERPTPVLLVTRPGVDRRAVVEALAAGALEVVEVPGAPRPELWKRLSEQLQNLARVSVAPNVRGKRKQVATHASLRPVFPVVAVAASLGGPKALVTLIRGLPKPLPASVVICQHITPGFTDDLARWLKTECGRDVREATEPQALRPDAFYLAPSNAHLVVAAGGKLELDTGPAYGGFRPSCDVLLKSVASTFGELAIGVVLTGMGRDGARGLKEIRARGGHTVAQDEASSVVFGMPEAAIAQGAAEKILPLGAIAAQIATWVGL